MTDSKRGPRLSFRRGADEIVLPLVLRETLIGRIDSNHLILEDSSVSRVHARILLEDGRCSIEDCGSSAGTLVNGEPIDRAQLKHGDVIRVGDVSLNFQQD
jgi:pSer/pThr/pTyr-binding forkhead associated (FHA) protein